MLLKFYLTFAVVVLMLITSMGIFGFLSSAHIEQTIGANQSTAKIESLERQINYHENQIIKYQDSIVASTRDLDLLNQYLAAGKIDLVQGLVGTAVDGNYGSNTAKKVEEFRKNAESKYSPARIEEWNDKIRNSEIKVETLNEEKFELETEYRVLEAEFGPVKYIAELFYDTNDDVNVLDEVVRWVIIAIIFVFDPLAVLLIIAANMTWMMKQEHKKKVAEAIQTTGVDLKTADNVLVKTKVGWKKITNSK